MLHQVRQLIVTQLWHHYTTDLSLISAIQRAVWTQYHEVLLWDHFALIDLPGPYTGIGPLSYLFSLLGYEIRGSDYLVEKQNKFVWLAVTSIATQKAGEALPQVVVADFHREVLDPEVRKIIDTYAALAKPLAIQQLHCLQKRILERDAVAVQELVALVVAYLKGRDWPLPTVKEFEIVRRHNELLAWVLVMGRQINHFGWAIHLSKKFTDLTTFNHFVSNKLNIPLNKEGGLIKGGRKQGIEQSATAAITKSIHLADGTVDLSDRFIEFVWRYPVCSSNATPVLWKDYFNGFVASNADRVVESLYTPRT
jgi:hypothetical protein